MNSNVEFINLLLDQAKLLFIGSDDDSDEDAYVQYVPALNCLDAASALANYPDELDFAKESGLTIDDSISDIEQAIFELCGVLPMEKNRSTNEIMEYMNEAFDKVWYCRTEECDNPEIEQKRLEAVKRIESTYKDLNELMDPETGYWEYGYWSGILSALRWVMGEEKDFLDT